MKTTFIYFSKNKMAKKKFKTKVRNQFFESLSVLKIGTTEISEKGKEKYLQRINQLAEKMKLDFGDAEKPVFYQEKYITINKYDNLLFLNSVFILSENLLKEVRENVLVAEAKHLALNYLNSLIFELTDIADSFFWQQAPWTDFECEVLSYSLDIPEEIKYSRDFPLPEIAISLTPILSVLQNLIENLISELELEKENTKNIPEANFETKITTAVLALYYYYRNENNEFQCFDCYDKITKIQAMKNQLASENHTYTAHFKNLFYAVGNGKANDPLKKGNLLKVIELLENKTTKMKAKANLESLITE